MEDRELKIKENACFLADKLNTISVSEDGVLPVYEVFSAIVDFGKITTEANRYYTEKGYPIDREDGSRHYTRYELAKFIPEIAECQEKLKSLKFDIKMNGVRPSHRHAFFQQQGFSFFVDALDYRCSVGEYITYEDSNLNRMKETLLTEVPAAAYEVWMNRQSGIQDPLLQDRISNLQDIYATFKGIVDTPDNHEMVYFNSERAEYAGPQFGRELEMVFDDIAKVKQPKKFK